MKNVPPLHQMLSMLINTPSVSCVNRELDMSNMPVINLLAEWLSDLGFNIEIMPIPGESAKANMIATYGKGNDGLVFSGHTDTVPCDEKKWDCNPFELVEKDQKYFGLGTCDMKSFFAIVLSVVKDLDLSQLKQPLILLATADEETTMSGAKALVKSKALNAKYAVIGEPTDLKPVNAHKGMMSESLTVFGKAGHSSNPKNGNSALEGMHQVISALCQWREALQNQYRNTLFKVPFPTLNFGYIKGGDNPNRICSECELQFDLRPLPGMSFDEIHSQMNKVVKDSLAGSGLSFQFRHLCVNIPAFEVDNTSALARTASRLTGTEPQAVAFGTEAPFLRQLNCDTLVLGPGSIEQAHQANEFLPLDTIKPMQDIIRSLIKTYGLI